MAHHPISSRVLDALLSSPTVPAKLKRKFVLGFMGRWHELVDDRIGSRVGERCWAAADGYMKARIPFSKPTLRYVECADARMFHL